ncbi:hypothetical protein F5882DRAFT_387349 [Hyaloscypha sp. PMI_1271]|nr:hypothetical protein F5882DRAFT_387349 [Hyaloscypha sp. PMI_1271]
MASSRKKRAANPPTGKGTKTKKTEPSPQAPKSPKPFPTKALIKIFRNLDAITATSFRLVCHKFEDIYLTHHAEVFKHHKLPLRLETRIRYADNTSQTLMACLKSWMPKDLVYDDFAEKFVTVDNLGKKFLQEIDALVLEKRARREWRKTLNAEKRKLIDEKRGFMEALGLSTDNMDFKWELQALGVDTMDLEPETESDSDEEGMQMAFPRRGINTIVEEGM